MTNDHLRTIDPAVGLTDAEVADRVARGLSNTVPDAPTRTIGQIVRGNVFTPINLVVAVLAALVLVSGSPKDALFAGVIVANSVIGIVQEVRAKRVLDRLSVISAPKAHAVRNGAIVELQVHQLVLDDIVELRSARLRQCGRRRGCAETAVRGRADRLGQGSAPCGIR